MSIKRLNYFNHQFLDEKDFRDEQNYQVEMRRTHNRRLHFWGVVEGLQVVRSGSREVTVGEGFALDREGRELVVSQPITREVAVGDQRERAYVSLGYKESNEEADRHGAGGIEGYNRTTETVEVHIEHELEKERPHVLLAHLHLNREGHIQQIDESPRRTAGSLLAHDSVQTRHLVDGAVTEPKLAKGLVESLRPRDFQLADGSITLQKLAPDLRTALSARGWVRLPFKPVRIRPRSREWGPEAGEFQIDVGCAYSDAKGARGAMGIPIPPGATRIREFRISGSSRGRKIRVQLYRSGWKEKQGETTEILNAEFVHAEFDKLYPAEEELDQHHAVTVAVSSEGESEIWLVAARFE